jgi:hypothetical protein
VVLSPLPPPPPPPPPPSFSTRVKISTSPLSCAAASNLGLSVCVCVCPPQKAREGMPCFVGWMVCFARVMCVCVCVCVSVCACRRVTAPSHVEPSRRELPRARKSPVMSRLSICVSRWVGVYNL